METLTIDLKKKKSFEIGQQGDHNALCIHFINMKNVGTNKKYIYYTIDGIENCVPLTNDRFIVGYPLTAHSGIASAQLISKLNDNSIIKLSNVFAMNIKESKGYKDSGEYPVDPNIQSSYDLLDDLIDQTQDLINNYNYATLMEKLTQASSEATTSANTAKKCADELKSSTDFINTLDDKVAAQDSKIEKIEASTSHITTKQNTKIAALQTRMSEFTSLKDGSTTGDAELIDARIGADGTKYPCLGDAMRTQLDGVTNKKLGLSYMARSLRMDDANYPNDKISMSTDSYSNFHVEFYKTGNYAYASVRIGKFSEFKGKNMSIFLRNNTSRELTNVRLYYSKGFDWNVINKAQFTGGKTFYVGDNIVDLDIPYNVSGYSDDDNLCIGMEFDNDSNNDNRNINFDYFIAMHSDVFEHANAVNAVNAVNAQNAQNAVNGKKVKFRVAEGIGKSYVIDGKLGGVRIKFGKGDVTSNICIITTESIGKVSELRDKMLLVRCVNRNENSDDDNSIGWNFTHTHTLFNQWGQDNGGWGNLYTLAKDGIRFTTIDFDNDNYKDDDDVYLRINNKSSYKPQTEFSMDIEIIVWVVDKEYEKEMGTYIASRLIGFEPSEYVKKTDISSLINAEKYITCWGDSLTAGGGWTNTLKQLSNMAVYNGGTGGEGSNTIVARQGADVMVINNITIPSDTTPVIIAKRSVDGGITTFEGNKVTPLLQGGAHVNPCKIGDVVGTLKWTGSDYADTNGTWTFERNERGSQVVINRPTAIRTNYDINRNAPYLMVIFMGQNGGYSDLDDLVRQHRLMIEHSKARYVVVLGLSSGTKAQRASYEERMRKEFGRYFISLREYLSTPIYDNSGTIISCYGMDDQNVSIDSLYTYNGKTTLQEIQEGSVPHQILADSVHYTSGTKDVIGKMLYKKCCELGIF